MYNKSKLTISFSFDDGRMDTYTEAYLIMKKYGLIGTIHVTTGFIDKTFSDYKWKSADLPLTIDQLKEMSMNGFEISTHGDRHISKIEDMANCHFKLKSWALIDRKFGFSVPTSKISFEQKESIISRFSAEGLSYIRVGRHSKCYKLESKVWFLIHKATKKQIFYNLFNRHNVINLSEQFDTYNTEFCSCQK